MSKKIELDNVRLSYEHIFTPSKFDESQAAKYSAEFIIPKDHPYLPTLKRAMYEAGKEAFPSAFTKPGEWPRGYTCSLQDADTTTDSNGVTLAEKNPAYVGCYILKTSTKNPPAVFDRNVRPVTEESGLIYSGCWVNVRAAAKGYTYGKIKKGITCYLNSVQFVGNGERFGHDPAADFVNLDGDEDEDFMG